MATEYLCPQCQSTTAPGKERCLDCGHAFEASKGKPDTVPIDRASLIFWCVSGLFVTVVVGGLYLLAIRFIR